MLLQHGGVNEECQLCIFDNGVNVETIAAREEEGRRAMVLARTLFVPISDEP
jgi:hypothetical protein